MTKEQILIIDDKVEIITFLSDLLEPMGYRLLVAMDGKEGLNKALGEKPDLILLDLNLPGLSGIEVLEALHRRDCRAPVILMTLYGSESVAVRAFRLGIRNYISKPFDINELLVAIEWALEEGRLRRERARLVKELEKSNRKLSQQMKELSTLQAIGRSVASLMPKEQLLRRLLDAATYLTGAEAGAIFLLDDEGDNLHLEAILGKKGYHFSPQTRIRDSHAKDVVRMGRPLWLPRPTKHTGMTGYLGSQKHSLFYAPIKSGGEAIGVLGVVCHRAKEGLPPEFEKRLVALADYAAIALRNARLYEDLERQTHQLATINRVAQMIASSLDLKEIMRTVARRVKEILGVESATLVLLDEEGKELTFEIILANGSEELGPFHLDVGTGIVGWVVQQGQPLRANDVSEEPHFYPGIDEAIGSRTRSILCVPLRISDRIIGAMEAINKLDDRQPEGYGNFSERDEKLLTEMAAFVAIAVQNARLHSAMQETIAAQTLQDTMVTLSHHLNNPLQVLLGSIEILKGDRADRRAIAQVTNMVERAVAEVSAVVSVLKEITSPEGTIYLGSIQMLDIEEELQARLASSVD